MDSKHELTEETRRKVVELYNAGTKLSKIEEECGVPRATIYWLLQQAGQGPNRVHKGARLSGRGQAVATVEWAFERLMQQEKEIERLTAEVERLNRKIARLQR